MRILLFPGWSKLCFESSKMECNEILIYGNFLKLKSSAISRRRKLFGDDVSTSPDHHRRSIDTEPLPGSPAGTTGSDWPPRTPGLSFGTLKYSESWQIVKKMIINILIWYFQFWFTISHYMHQNGVHFRIQDWGIKKYYTYIPAVWGKLGKYSNISVSCKMFGKCWLKIFYLSHLHKASNLFQG